MANKVKFFVYGKSTVYVKVEFFTICPHPEKLTRNELMETGITQYLHNEDGPAVVQSLGKLENEYWLNGVNYTTMAEWEQAKHNLHFNEELQGIIHD